MLNLICIPLFERHWFLQAEGINYCSPSISSQNYIKTLGIFYFHFPFFVLKHTQGNTAVIWWKKFSSLWTISEQLAVSVRDSEIIKRKEYENIFLSPSDIFLLSQVSQDRLLYIIFSSPVETQSKYQLQCQLFPW